VLGGNPSYLFFHLIYGEPTGAGRSIPLRCLILIGYEGLGSAALG
jgi:hypothetical protein